MEKLIKELQKFSSRVTTFYEPCEEIKKLYLRNTKKCGNRI